MNIKTGIDYFPFDIDFFLDDKIQFVSARFGTKGEAITVRLLCKIYRTGYFTLWNEDTALLFAKGVGDGCSDSCVNDVVQELVKRGFFDKGIYDRFGILTSRGIQRRYLEASKRRKTVDIERSLLLINPSEYQNVNITNQNVDILNENADILKQSKVKESKEKGKVNIPARGKSAAEPDIPAGFQVFWDKYPHHVSKQAAIKAFKHIKASELAAVMDGLDRAIQSVDWQRNIRDGTLNYIPHASTWINGRRWEDDVGGGGQQTGERQPSKYSQDV